MGLHCAGTGAWGEPVNNTFSLFTPVTLVFLTGFIVSPLNVSLLPGLLSELYLCICFPIKIYDIVVISNYHQLDTTWSH